MCICTCMYTNTHKYTYNTYITHIQYRYTYKKYIHTYIHTNPLSYHIVDGRSNGSQTLGFSCFYPGVRACLLAYMCTRTHTFTHTHMPTCMRTCKHAYMQTNTCIHAYMHTCRHADRQTDRPTEEMASIHSLPGCGLLASSLRSCVFCQSAVEAMAAAPAATARMDF